MYSFWFRIFLIISVIPIFNNILLSKVSSVRTMQKFANNAIYFFTLLILSYLFLFYSDNKGYSLTLFYLSRGIPVVFSVNSINIMFSFVIVSCIFFFNMFFQNYFSNLNIEDRYVYYNRQMSFLYLFCILASFSQNIIVTIILHTTILIFSFFLISYSDLKDFRKKYASVFVAGFAANVVLLISFLCYFIYNDYSAVLAIQSVKKLDSLVPLYWLEVIFFLLIAAHFCGHNYMVFDEKFYHEDLLPIFVINFIPFVVLNTFIFLKVLFYVFYNNLSNIGLYFYYAEFFVVALFIVSVVFLIKHIKDNLKYPTLYNIANFMVFLSQILFVNSEKDIMNIFSYFLLFVFAVVISTLVFVGFLLSMLKTETRCISLLSKMHGNIVLFSMLCMLLPPLVNIIAWFSSDFHNLNIFYIVNFVEIIFMIGVHIAYVILLFKVEPKNTKKKREPLSKSMLISLFAPQTAAIAMFCIVFLARNQITNFIMFYK